MNKLLIFISFLFVFCLKINAYEIEVSRNVNENAYRLFIDSHNNILQLKFIQNGNTSYYNESNSRFWGVLNTIQKTRSSENFYNGNGYISRNTFDSLLKENPELLNDFYTEATQQILNYYYNNSNFTNTGHINYTNYQILYDDSGYAVESIVNGVWKGLYNTQEEINNSGWLYDKQTKTYYKNGVEASYISTLVRLILGKYQNTIRAMFALNVLGAVLVLIAVICILRICLRLLHHALSRTRLNINIGKHF